MGPRPRPQPRPRRPAEANLPALRPHPWTCGGTGPTRGRGQPPESRPDAPRPPWGYRRDSLLRGSADARTPPRQPHRARPGNSTAGPTDATPPTATRPCKLRAALRLGRPQPRRTAPSSSPASGASAGGERASAASCGAGARMRRTPAPRLGGGGSRHGATSARDPPRTLPPPWRTRLPLPALTCPRSAARTCPRRTHFFGLYCFFVLPRVAFIRGPSCEMGRPRRAAPLAVALWCGSRAPGAGLRPAARALVRSAPPAAAPGTRNGGSPPGFLRVCRARRVAGGRRQTDDRAAAVRGQSDGERRALCRLRAHGRSAARRGRRAPCAAAPRPSARAPAQLPRRYRAACGSGSSAAAQRRSGTAAQRRSGSGRPQTCVLVVPCGAGGCRRDPRRCR